MLKAVVVAALAGTAAAFVAPQGFVRLGPSCGTARFCSALKPSRPTAARHGAIALRAQAEDDLGEMFQSAGPLVFDLENSDNENMAIASHKAQKITESEPAWALFGDDKEDSVQRVGVTIVKVPVKQNSVFIGAVKLPRSPARACFADTLRTPCIMVEKGGSVYRTGRIGTKLVEYLGKDIKKYMGDSYPPKFKDGDVVKMELNKATGEFKVWVNDGVPCVVQGVSPASKFFVNAEAKDSQFEIMRLED